MECHPKKIKIIKDVNDDALVFNSSKMVLEVNERDIFLNYEEYSGKNI